MIAEFSTFGSCSSRNIFYTQLNPNYKNFFHINYSVEAISLISLMSSNVEYNLNLLDSPHNYDNICVKEDFSKNFLNFLKQDSIDYIVIDTFFDVVDGIIIIDDDKYVTDTGRLHQTSLYENYKNYPKLNIKDNFDEYFDLWIDSCHKFFNFLGKFSKSKIILNCSRSVFKYIHENHIIEDENLKKLDYTNNLRDILDSYIIDNFDVEVLPFSANILADKNHIFGLHSSHYEKKYYLDKTTQLNEIIFRNNSLLYDDELNIKIRKLKRERIISDFKIKKQLSMLEHRTSELNRNLCNEKFNNKCMVDEISSYKEDISQLKEKNSNLIDEYNELINSNSWKITKPLRNLKRYM